MSEIEIGRAKRGRRAYSFDDIAIVPSRRTRDPEEVGIAWQIDAYRFELPIMAAPMDSVMSPDTAIALGRHGGLGDHLRVMGSIFCCPAFERRVRRALPHTGGLGRRR